MNVYDWIVQLMGIAMAVAAAPALVGWVNQCRAWLQNKSAPQHPAAVPRNPETLS